MVSACQELTEGGGAADTLPITVVKLESPGVSWGPQTLISLPAASWVSFPRHALSSILLSWISPRFLIPLPLVCVIAFSFLHSLSGSQYWDPEVLLSTLAGLIGKFPAEVLRKYIWIFGTCLSNMLGIAGMIPQTCTLSLVKPLHGFTDCRYYNIKNKCITLGISLQDSLHNNCIDCTVVNLKLNFTLKDNLCVKNWNSIKRSIIKQQLIFVLPLCSPVPLLMSFGIYLHILLRNMCLYNYAAIHWNYLLTSFDNGWDLGFLRQTPTHFFFPSSSQNGYITFFVKSVIRVYIIPIICHSLLIQVYTMIMFPFLYSWAYFVVWN